MIDPGKQQEAIELYDRFTHEGLDRRVMMTRIATLVGSMAAAEALIAAIAPDPAAAAIIPDDDERLTTLSRDLGGGYKGYVAEPRTRSLKATVMVIHENRGLNDHSRDIARRLAVAGFRAVAVDFLSLAGGTPGDENKAREMIGKLDLAKTVEDAAAMLSRLAGSSRGGKVGAVGFCWGGGFVNRLAVTAGDRLDAGVVYYGAGANPSEAGSVSAPLMIHHAGLDSRIAQTLWPWIDALRGAGKPVSYFNYEGVNHAFNNDTSAERYDKAAADLAWQRTLRFFRKHLG